MPLGVYDDPPPEDADGIIKSISVGDNAAARALQLGTSAFDEASDLISSVLPG